MYSCLCIRAHTCCTRTLTIFMCFKLLNLCICVYPLAQALCITLSFVYLCNCDNPLYRKIYSVTCVHFRWLTDKWAYRWAVTYCCFVWFVLRHSIGSLQSLLPVTPNHNKVSCLNQNFSVYSSGILVNIIFKKNQTWIVN